MREASTKGAGCLGALPKAFEVDVVGTSFERALHCFNGNAQACEGHVGAFLRTLLPIDETSFSNPFQGIVQAMANYDFFRDRHIVPVWEENLELQLRSTHRASRLGQVLILSAFCESARPTCLPRGDVGSS